MGLWSRNHWGLGGSRGPELDPQHSHSISQPPANQASGVINTSFPQTGSWLWYGPYTAQALCAWDCLMKPSFSCCVCQLHQLPLLHHSTGTHSTMYWHCRIWQLWFISTRKVKNPNQTDGSDATPHHLIHIHQKSLAPLGIEEGRAVATKNYSKKLPTSCQILLLSLYMQYPAKCYLCLCSILSSPATDPWHCYSSRQKLLNWSCL